MQTDTYNSPFNARYASKEMQYIYSPDLSLNLAEAVDRSGRSGA